MWVWTPSLVPPGAHALRRYIQVMAGEVDRSTFELVFSDDFTGDVLDADAPGGELRRYARLSAYTAALRAAQCIPEVGHSR